MARKAAHMEFVDDRLAHRRRDRHVAFPIEFVEIQAAAPRQTTVGGAVRDIGHAPFLAAADGARVRIEHDGFGIETMSGLGRKGSAQAVAVKAVQRQVEDKNVPDVAGFIQRRLELNFGERLFLAGLEENQREGLRVPGEDRKVDAADAQCRAERPRLAAGGDKKSLGLKRRGQRGNSLQPIRVRG